MQQSDDIKLSLDDTSIPRLPPPSRHSRSQTVDLRTSSPNRSSTYLPFWNTSRSSSPQRPASPTDSDVTFHTVEEDKRPSVKKLSSWFEGSSQPVNIGLVASPREESEKIMSSANTSRFSFFSRRSTTHLPQSDGLENLNIKDTLLPNGQDEFSPAAFKNLQQNAEGALKLFQQAYRESQISLKKVSSERNVQADELEAAQTRNEHLKSQLLDMADRATAQEKLIVQLQAENDRLNEAQSRTIRLITDDDERPARRNRSSDVSMTSASTYVSSIFSHQDNDSPATSVCPSPVVKHASPQLQYARVVTPHVQSNNHLNSLSADVRVAVQECSNCRGLSSDEAWDVLNIKISENVALKQYIQEMESAAEAAENLCIWQPIELQDINRRCSNMISGQAGLQRMDDGLVEEENQRTRNMRGCIV